MAISKNIIITGGTDGIGLAIAKKLSLINENKVIIVGRNDLKGKKVIKDLNLPNFYNVIYQKKKK